MDLKDIKTSKELEAYWEKEGDITRMVIDAERDFPNIEEDMKNFLNKKNVVFINVSDFEKPIHGENACTAYLTEFPQCLAQGTSKIEALEDIYQMLKEILPLEVEYVKWLDVITTYENLKSEKDMSELIAILEAKYSIKDNDLFI